MDHKSCLPEELEAHAIDDERFAQAYEAAGDRQRSVLKSLIAALWHLHAPKRVRSEMHELGWEQGGGVLLLTRPLSWTILCVDASTASPGLVLSALMPALTSGVSEIAVIGIGIGALTHPVLTALELAGQERVFELQAPEATLLARSVAPAHSGIIMCLGHDAQAAFANARLPMWSPKPRADGQDCPSGFSLGVFLEEEQEYTKQFKLDIDYLLPGVAIEWWSPSGKLGPSKAQRRAGDFPCFGKNCFDAVLVPQRFCRLALETFPVVLGLDRAGHWLWPGLTDDHFRLRHSAMF
ncbi:hypothetical protein [Desulfocurvibacter africanus]|uniref:hypothetical protein n=1 Tax=Desulfocurvibacter africanus TaxID=873 RepID=UPI000489364C|nr:hypothetical protein [Desulfocurvibacter africanus]